MSSMFKKMVGLLSVCFLQAASAATVEEARAQALSATNFWGISFSIDERNAFASNYVSTARLYTDEANAVFQELNR